MRQTYIDNPYSLYILDVICIGNRRKVYIYMSKENDKIRRELGFELFPDRQKVDPPRKSREERECMDIEERKRNRKEEND